MTIQYLDIAAYDPSGVVSNPARSLGPAQRWNLAIADQDFGTYARWIYIGGNGGNLNYIDWTGNTVTNFPVIQYSMFFMAATRIVGSSTASNIWWST